MDILLIPQEATSASVKVPYVCSDADRWDCGNFLSYAERYEHLRNLRADHRWGGGNVLESSESAGNSSATDDPDGSYDGILYPLPRETQQRTFTTWLFIGLLAEFFGLNEPADGLSRVVSGEQAAEDLEILYMWCVSTSENETKILSARILLEDRSPLRHSAHVTPIERSPEHWKLYFQHQRECLQLTYDLMRQYTDPLFDERLLGAIAALGEYFNAVTNAKTARHATDFRPLQLSWHTCSRLGSGTNKEHMLQRGWCKSDIERMTATYQSVNTLHYLSKMKRHCKVEDHVRCSELFCQVGQINMQDYAPSHVPKDGGCKCNLFPEGSAIAQQVDTILLTTGSFPLLHFTRSAKMHDGTGATVEAYTDGIPFVALSHVWADGLGNPKENAIQACQFSRLSRLVSNLQVTVEGTVGAAKASPYRLWIDTICCPVSPEGKTVALNRIAQVYSKAMHVLVLDSSLTTFNARDVHPLQPLLRIFALSTWMRRLWTLQEGVLAQSLWFQFADGPVQAINLLVELQRRHSADPRHQKVFNDIHTEYIRLTALFAQSMRASPSPVEWSHEHLPMLLTALRFRRVTMKEDEPLCLATLMSLDLHISLEDNADERMAKVWQLLSEKQGGLPAKIIFFVDNPIPKSGWHWAPRSLLQQDRNSDSAIPEPSKISGFWAAELPLIMRSMRPRRGGEEMKPLHSGPHYGWPEKRGFRVRFPGARLIPQPRRGCTSLWPWQGLLQGYFEDRVLVRQRVGETHKWFQLSNAHRISGLRKWSQSRIEEYDRTADFPVSRAICTGRCALIRDWQVGNVGESPGLLVQIEEETAKEADFEGNPTTRGPPESVLYVHTAFRVVVRQLQPQDAFVLMTQKLRELADVASADPSTQAFLQLSQSPAEGSDHTHAVERVVRRMRELTGKMATEDPGFLSTVQHAVGSGSKETIWKGISVYCSRDVVAESLPEDQTWVLD